MTGIVPCSRFQCYICGAPGKLHRHHCLHGSMRRKAESYGLTVFLCWDCHRRLHDYGEHDLELQQVAQRAFEEKYDHELWMQEFGRNYL